MNRRRQLCCCALASWLPLAAVAQAAENRRPLVSVLGAGSPSTTGPLIDRFKRYLAELGWVEGRNVRYAVRFAEGRLERLPALARELVALNPDVIWTALNATALAAQRATSSIPIVFAGVTDPVALGLAKSLAAPGGNATGLSTQTLDLAPKLLELLSTARPGLSRVAFLWNPTLPTDRSFERVLSAAADQQRITLVSAELASLGGLDAAIEQMRSASVEAAILSLDPVQIALHSQIDDFLIGSRIPAIHTARDPVQFFRAALMAYGRSVDEQWRLSAGYVDRILRGIRPAEMPIEQPTRVEMMLNLRAARALGITIPQSLLLRADEVIE